MKCSVLRLFSKVIQYLFPVSHVEVTSQVQEVSAIRCNLETCHQSQPDLGAEIFPERKKKVGIVQLEYKHFSQEIYTFRKRQSYISCD